MCERKTVRPRVREISRVYLYGEVYGGKDLRKICVLSLEWKREGVIDGDRGGDVDDRVCFFVQLLQIIEQKTFSFITG